MALMSVRGKRQSPNIAGFLYDRALTCRVVSVSFVSPLLEHVVWHSQEKLDV